MNIRQLLITKTTDGNKFSYDFEGFEEFSIEEMTEIIRILFNINQINLSERKKLSKELIYEH